MSDRLRNARAKTRNLKSSMTENGYGNERSNREIEKDKIEDEKLKLLNEIDSIISRQDDISILIEQCPDLEDTGCKHHHHHHEKKRTKICILLFSLCVCIGLIIAVALAFGLGFGLR